MEEHRGLYVLTDRDRPVGHVRRLLEECFVIRCADDAAIAQGRQLCQELCQRPIAMVKLGEETGDRIDQFSYVVSDGRLLDGQENMGNEPRTEFIERRHTIEVFPQALSKLLLQGHFHAATS